MCQGWALPGLGLCGRSPGRCSGTRHRGEMLCPPQTPNQSGNGFEELSTRNLSHHSKHSPPLQGADGVILGASSLTSMKKIAHTLPQDLDSVKALWLARWLPLTVRV